MRAHIRDTEIFFDVDGTGLVASEGRVWERPTAFLIHGGPGADHLSLKDRYGALAQSMQLIYFDHRGHGRSARDSVEKYTLDENVEDMEALRRYLGLEQIVSIGTSYGGMVAMAHAARYPGSVSHLILIATAAHAGYAARARQIVAERGTPEQQLQCEALFAGRLDTAEKLRHFHDVMGSLYSRTHDGALAKTGLDRTIFTPEPLNMAHGPDGFLRRFDLRPQLSAITAPTFIASGRHDWICAPEFSAEIHRLMPASDLRIFEESGHSIGTDEPQKLVDAIVGFIAYKFRGK